MVDHIERLMEILDTSSLPTTVASPDHEGRSLLFFMNQIVMGGVEKVLLTYLRRLQDTGKYTCAVVCLTQVKDPFFLNFFKEQKIPLYVVDKKIKQRRKRNFIARWIYRIYRTRMEYDINRSLERLAAGFGVLIDFHNFACASYLRRLPQKKIGFCHGSIVFFMERVKKKHLGIYDRMICLSHAFERDFKQVYPEWMDKICCIYNPIEAEKTCQLSHVNAPIYPQPYFVAVQPLNEFDKDVPSVIRGFALFNKEYPGYRLVIVGEGAQRSELERLAMDEGIGACIIFTGRLDNPYPVMSKASALILSSLQQVGEGFDQVLIEAQSLGVPAVSSDVPSAPAEILLDGEAGYLFEAGNPKSLAQTLRNVVGKPSERRNKIRKATKALERFNPTKTISQLEKILDFGY